MLAAGYLNATLLRVFFEPTQRTDYGQLCMKDVVLGLDDALTFRMHDTEFEFDCEVIAGLKFPDAKDLKLIVTQEPIIVTAEGGSLTTIDPDCEETPAKYVVKEAHVQEPFKLTTASPLVDTVSCEDDEPEFEAGFAEPVIVTALPVVDTVSCEEEADGGDYEFALTPEPVIITAVPELETVSCEDEDVVQEPEFEHGFAEPALTSAKPEETVSCEEESEIEEIEAAFTMAPVTVRVEETVSCEEEDVVQEPEFEHGFAEPALTSAKPEETVSCEEEGEIEEIGAAFTDPPVTSVRAEETVSCEEEEEDDDDIMGSIEAGFAEPELTTVRIEETVSCEETEAAF
jgi:hypothetical protein